MVCQKCGCDVGDYKYCPECGEKLIADENCAKMSSEIISNVPSSNSESNQATNKKTINWKIIFVLFSVVVIMAILIAVFAPVARIDGKYKYVGDSKGGFYVFKNGSYTYSASESSGTYSVGTYRLKGDRLITFDSDGNEEWVFYKKGDYIFSSNPYFDQKIENGSRVNQELSLRTETEVNGVSYQVTFDVSLLSDGTYHYKTVLSADGMVGKVYNHETGKYTKSGNVLYLHSDDDDNEHIFMIRGNRVYLTVYKKD